MAERFTFSAFWRYLLSGGTRIRRKKRVNEASRTYAYSAAHGGMRPYSEIRAAKGYTQTDTD
jgi:hypothetical protein